MKKTRFTRNVDHGQFRREAFIEGRVLRFNHANDTFSETLCGVHCNEIAVRQLVLGQVRVLHLRNEAELMQPSCSIDDVHGGKSFQSKRIEF